MPPSATPPPATRGRRDEAAMSRTSQHVVAVGWILDRAGFGEDVVIAGLLARRGRGHAGDARGRRGAVRGRRGRPGGGLLRGEDRRPGEKRPWIDRKRDHLAALAEAPAEARAVMLADKLHNLISIELDLREGRPVWSQFHAERDQVLWYYREAIRTLRRGRPASRTARRPMQRGPRGRRRSRPLILSMPGLKETGPASPGASFFEFAGLPVDPAWLAG